jgi:hypothetical protein
MTVIDIIQLIIKYGPSFAASVAEIFGGAEAVTPEMITKLKELREPESYFVK